MSKHEISRRKLLTGLGATMVPSIYSPNVFSATKKDKLGVALLGLGYYSRDLLAPALQLTEHCELKAIVTGSPEKIPIWQKRYGIKDANVYSYRTLPELANNPEVDIVYVVVPTSLHKKFALMAADAGKHVWCEKPMAMTVEDCQEIINACRKNAVQLTVGYRLQHEPNTQTLMQYATSRPYGVIQSLLAKAGYAGSVPAADNWRLKRAMGGGALYDMGVYPINAARNMIGEEPLRVEAQLGANRKAAFTQVDENCHVTLSFPSGATATCLASVGENMNELRVNCDKGWYALEPFQSYSDVQGRASDGALFNKTIANQQAKQMDNDALAIKMSTPVLVPGEEGLLDIRVVQAALKSAAGGGSSVTI